MDKNGNPVPTQSGNEDNRNKEEMHAKAINVQALYQDSSFFQIDGQHPDPIQTTYRSKTLWPDI